MVFSIRSLFLFIDKLVFVQFGAWLIDNMTYLIGGGICITGVFIIVLAIFGRPDMELESSFISIIGLLIGLASLIIEIIAIMGG